MHPSDESPRVVLIHRVNCKGVETSSYHKGHPGQSWFFDTPRLFSGDNKKSALRGERGAVSAATYLLQHFEPVYDEDDEDGEDNNDTTRDFVIAVVERSYDCVTYHQLIKEDFELTEFRLASLRIDRKLQPYLFVLKADGPEASCFAETMKISNKTLLATLQQIAVPETYSFVEPVFPETSEAPYLPFYRFRDSIKRQIARLDDQTLRTQLVVLLQYVLETCKDDYAEADSLFSQGLVNQRHFSKMFGPNEIILSHAGGHPFAYVVDTLIEKAKLWHDLKCWSWSFDGVFRRTSVQLQATWPDLSEGDIDITSLKIYPLKFATPETKERLEKRGRRVWACRRKAYVSYRPPNLSFDVQMANPRFMVDMRIYNELHSDPDESGNDNSGSGSLEPERIEQDEPPDGDFVLLLPETVVGYGFHDKKWKTLQAEYITDIDWQTEAFDRLVLDQNKKDIIKALVSVHVSTAVLNEPNDIIEGKGNGLILLLHGSPGTGKTLTAESIAELTRKPLYRVTCGDVGIEPESVEKYLDSVLYIGTVWGCVVLLDEADVFLEERTQADLQRNALVSVFLRVLEYYNGILILTTNRVGIFDEAFKSRIQLSIHYPPLDLQGRLEIWLNFFNTMKEGDDIDLTGLKRKADLLARYRINGREIRNTVKSARQLAYYKNEQLNHSHFDRVIRIADEFDRYIEKAHGGNTDEEWARDSHTRA